jgi:cytochrome P450
LSRNDDLFETTLDITPNRETLTFDPRDSSLFAHDKRDGVFARLRESDRVAVDRNGSVPVYSLVRYADVERAYKEPDVFSPCAGLTLDAFDPKVCETPSRMLEMAPPAQHRELKGAMQGAFRGSALAEIRSRVDEHLDRFLTTAAGGGAVEFVGAYARDAGTLMMAELLGLSAAEAERLAPVLGKIGELDAGESPASVLRRQKGEFRLLRELTRVVGDHRAGGRSAGLIGILLAAELEGEPLSDHDVALNCFNAAAAGTGASQHTLAGAAAVWAEHPADLAAVTADPKLARRLVEETLRWLTPVLHLTRILTSEVEISGQRLPQGSCVCLWNISANRDEAVFEDGSAFKPDRPPGRNLAFGAGPQYCLGAEIVRVQLEALLAGMARHDVRFELVEAPTWMRSNALAGVESLTLRVCR